MTDAELFELSIKIGIAPISLQHYPELTSAFLELDSLQVFNILDCIDEIQDLNGLFNFLGKELPKNVFAELSVFETQIIWSRKDE